MGGKYDRPGLINPAFASFLPVDVQGDHAALRQAAAVLGKLHSHLVGYSWDLGFTLFT